MEFSSIVIGLLTFLPIIYWFLTKNYKFWQKQGIPGPKPVFLFGNFLDRVFRSMAENDVIYKKKFGKIYGIFNGTAPVLQVSEPELVKQILVKEFHRFNNRRELQTHHEIVNTNLFHNRGEDWKKIRTITSSTFTSGKMKKLYGLVRERVAEYVDYLDGVATSGRPLDVKTMHENLTLDVIACCAFATKTNSIKEPDNPLISHCRRIFDMKAKHFIPSFVFPKWLNNLLGVKSMWDEESNQYLIRLTKHIIDKRRQTSEKNIDFVQLLLDAKAGDKSDKDTDTSDFYLNEDDNMKKEWDAKYANKSLSEEEILGQAWIFLLAGFETTAATLAFMSHCLALNQDCQTKLYEELIAAIGPEGEISYDDLHRLPYLDACVSETLRLFSPVARLEREANSDFKLIHGDREIRFTKGQMVEIPIYVMQRSEEYFPNPDQYIPNRFLSENRKNIIPYTYMPFGTGPRNCIGMRFALMEIKLAMAHILTKFRFTTADKTQTNLKFKPVTPMCTPYEVVLGLEKR